MSAIIRVMCVDDHPLMREGIGKTLAVLPDVQLVGEACDGNRAIETFRVHRPDVTIMDLMMPNLDGINTMIAIRAEFPAARFVALSDHSGEVLERRALAAGASVVISKAAMGDELVAAIRYVHAQAQVGGFSDDIASTSVDDSDTINQRELEILKLIATGNSNREIAHRVGLAESTVNNYVKKILAKLGASDRTHAVTRAMQRGFIDPRR